MQGPCVDRWLSMVQKLLASHRTTVDPTTALLTTIPSASTRQRRAVVSVAAEMSTRICPIRRSTHPIQAPSPIAPWIYMNLFFWPYARGKSNSSCSSTNSSNNTFNNNSNNSSSNRFNYSSCPTCSQTILNTHSRLLDYRQTLIWMDRSKDTPL